jgi:glycosyltransferase involved in cell wall biosynthesis
MLIHMLVVVAAGRYLKRTGFQPDIIHTHIFVMAPFALGLSKLMRVPLVITEQASSFPRGQVRGRMLQIVKIAYRYAAMILPVSAWLQESMQSVGIRGRFRVIPNTVDLNLFFPERKKAVRSSLPRLLIVGLLTEPKGIPYLLEALHIVKGKGKRFHLDIVGDGAQRAEYEQLAEDLGLQDVVTFHGLKGKQEVAHMMRQSSFYLQPSLWETFCVAIIEAMACGKPVIGTQIPVFLEKVGPNMGLLVPPRDSVQLAAAIETMLDRYTDFNGSEIARHIGERFSHEAVGKLLSDVYDDVLRQN